MQTVDLPTVKQTLAHTPNIIASWLFGAAQNGVVRPGGDLDIGVLFAEKPLLDELADLRGALQDATDFEEIDLVVLNGASPILRFEAVCGRLLTDQDTAERVAFVSLTAREYEHSMAMLERGLAMRRDLQAGQADR